MTLWYDRYEYSIYYVDEDRTEQGSFDSNGRCYDNYVLLMDIQLVGENIGRELLDKYGKKLDNENLCNEKLIEKINCEILDGLRQELSDYAQEYIDNNICDCE